VNVIDWLLDSDPSIRWQVMRDLTAATDEAVAAERSRVAREGWGARLLAEQSPSGRWGVGDLSPEDLRTGDSLPEPPTRRLLRELSRIEPEEVAEFMEVDLDTVSRWESGEADDEPSTDRYRSMVNWMRATVGTYNPKWISTTYTLLLLRDMGIDPDDTSVGEAISLVHDGSKHDVGQGGFFDGETEPCINGMVVAIGSYFGWPVDPVVERLLGEQLADGGWNCEAVNGSTRSSFHTTICILEGLLGYENALGGEPAVATARNRAEEYLLERRLFRRMSNGEIIDPVWTLFSFPPRFHYDVLRGLDYFRSTGAAPDSRLSDGVELLESKRQADGRWTLENTHPARVYFEMDDGDGQPSRWNTLRAMRVLDWYRRSSN
jgi:transcriptional regulator with XRE-family HTH domain